MKLLCGYFIEDITNINNILIKVGVREMLTYFEMWPNGFCDLCEI